MEVRRPLHLLETLAWTLVQPSLRAAPTNPATVHQFLGAIGRACSVVNLDPANDRTSYPCAIDIRDLVKLEEAMTDDMLYALEALESNFDWLEEGLKELGEDYVLFDCPGQVELYTHHESLRNIIFKLSKLGYRAR